MRKSSALHLDGGHHSLILVIENVAVLNRLACEILKPHAKARALSRLHQQNVAPCRLRQAIVANELEWVGVQVYRVIHLRAIYVHPILDRAESRRRIDSVCIELLTVDGEAHAASHHHRLAQLERA